VPNPRVHRHQHRRTFSQSPLCTYPLPAISFIDVGISQGVNTNGPMLHTFSSGYVTPTSRYDVFCFLCILCINPNQFMTTIHISLVFFCFGSFVYFIFKYRSLFSLSFWLS
jgi:hypothetical protein